METIYLSLRAQVAVGTFFMKSPVPLLYTRWGDANVSSSAKDREMSRSLFNVREKKPEGHETPLMKVFFFKCFFWWEKLLFLFIFEGILIKKTLEDLLLIFAIFFY